MICIVDSDIDIKLATGHSRCFNYGRSGFFSGFYDGSIRCNCNGQVDLQVDLQVDGAELLIR